MTMSNKLVDRKAKLDECKLESIQLAPVFLLCSMLQYSFIKCVINSRKS